MHEKKCPNCGLWNPPSAVRCDCGYDFNSLSVETPLPGAVAPAAEKRALTELDWILVVILSVANSIYVESNFLIALGMAMGLLGMTVIGVGIPVLIYWLFKRRLIPKLRILFWAVWFVLAVTSTVGNQSINKYRSTSLIGTDRYTAQASFRVPNPALKRTHQTAVRRLALR